MNSFMGSQRRHIVSDNNELVFSVEEFKGRIERVRESMEEAGLDLLLVHTPENIYYLTGYRTPGYYTYQCFILPLDSEPMMLIRFMEEGNIMAQSWVEKRVTYQDTEDPVEVTSNTLKGLGVSGKRVGIEKSSWFLTTAAYEQLTATFQDVTFTDASDVVNKVRLIKSPAEIAYIREAAKAAENGVRMGMEAIAAGKTENDVAAAALTGMLREGSEYTGLAPFVASGPRSALGHATWERRKLEEGDLVFLEIPGCINRYHAAQMRTAVIGKPPAEWEDIAKVVIDGLSAAIETIKPGVMAGEVDDACRGTITRGGYGEYFLYRTGYSIGIAFPPDWGEGHILSLRGGESTELQPGMTFHMPPSALMYGVGGIGFSETVLVTETGCEAITRYPRELVVID